MTTANILVTENSTKSSSKLISNSDGLPKILFQAAYLRIWQICDCKKPDTNPLLPISRTTFLDGVREGRFPKPTKIGRTSCWKAEDIKQLLIDLGNQ